MTMICSDKYAVVVIGSRNPCSSLGYSEINFAALILKATSLFVRRIGIGNQLHYYLERDTGSLSIPSLKMPKPKAVFDNKTALKRVHK